MITTEQLKPECKEEPRNDFKASLMKDRSRRERSFVFQHLKVFVFGKHCQMRPDAD